MSNTKPFKRPATQMTRRAMISTAAQLGMLATLGASASASAGTNGAASEGLVNGKASSTLPERSEFVVRGGIVLTMDKDLGDLNNADVHVRDGRIIGLGTALQTAGVPSIDATGMIVMPGFVETHWHLWNAIYRNLVPIQGSYLAVKRQLAPYHNAVDFGRAVRLALLEALNAGITTVHNFSHNVIGPDYADAELEAMRSSGLRGRYSYGWPDSWPVDRVMPLDDIPRVQRDWMEKSLNADRRLTMGLVARGPQYTEPSVYRQEFEFARKHQLPITLHAGPFARPVSAVELLRDGFLDETTILVQFQQATAEDREAMLESGAWNSLGALLNHMRGPIEADINNLVRMVNMGINTCLSVDATPTSAVNMFEIMRSLWQLGVPSAAGGHGVSGMTRHGAGAHGKPMEKLSPITLEQCLEMATIGGAKALGLGDETGSLAVGKLADIILVRTTDINMIPSAYPQAALVGSASVANVDTVIADGRVLKHDGKIVGVDVATITRDAEESLRAIRRRAGLQEGPSKPGQSSHHDK